MRVPANFESLAYPAMVKIETGNCHGRPKSIDAAPTNGGGSRSLSAGSSDDDLSFVAQAQDSGVSRRRGLAV